MKLIPFYPSDSSRQEFSVNLGEQVCIFNVSWNGRAGAWFMDLKTSEGFINNVRLVETTSLLADNNGLGLGGNFRVLKTNKLTRESITYDNLGSDWTLTFATNEEWASFDAIINKPKAV